MKKYIYGAVLIAVVATVVIFLFRPPETGDKIPAKTLAITFQFPEGYELTQGAPFVLTWQTKGSGGALSVPVADPNFDPFVSPYKLVFTPLLDTQAVILNARLYYCHKTTRMCFQDDFRAHVPLGPEAVSTVPWVWKIIPKKT